MKIIETEQDSGIPSDSVRVILKVKWWEKDFIFEARNWTGPARSGWADIQSTFISFCFLEIFGCSCNFVEFVLKLRFSRCPKLLGYFAFLSKWPICVKVTGLSQWVVLEIESYFYLFSLTLLAKFRLSEQVLFNILS